MHPLLVLSIYCLCSVVASLSGGWVPMVVRLTHRRMQIAISFVSGMILGIGLLHLLPHSLEVLGSIDRAVAWMLAGFLFLFFLERFFPFHHHDVAEDEAHDHAHHDHGHHAPHDHAQLSGRFSLAGAAAGMTLHGLVDGVAMAAAVKADEGSPMVVVAGLGAFLAIVLHKPFDSLTIGTLMAASGRSAASRHVLNFLYALITPLGVVLFYAVASRAGHPQEGLGQALGLRRPALRVYRRQRFAARIAISPARSWRALRGATGGHRVGLGHRLLRRRRPRARRAWPHACDGPCRGI